MNKKCENMPGDRAPSTTLSSSTSDLTSWVISCRGRSHRSHSRALLRGPTGPVFQLWMTSRTRLLKRSSNWANKAQDLNRQTRISKAAPKPKRHQENRSLKRVTSLTIGVRKLRKSKTPLVQRQRRRRVMRINSVLLKRKSRRRWRKEQMRRSGRFKMLT